MSDVETTNPVHDGIVARVEAALKSGAVWIEDHFHALLDNIETAIGGGTPTADPLPAETAAQAAPAEQAAPAVDTGAALANEQAAEVEQKAADETPQ